MSPSCQSQADSKARALGGFTLDMDAATHLLDQFFANRQTQATTAIFARCGAVCLRKGIEYLLLSVGGDADAGVFNREQQGCRPAIVILDINVEGDCSLAGEFDAIIDQIIQHLRRIAREVAASSPGAPQAEVVVIDVSANAVAADDNGEKP